jgi:hypothetical protein
MSALNEISKEVTKAVAAPPQPENLPPVSTSMADVSARLTALEDAVAELKKAVFPPPAPGPVNMKNILPSAPAGNGQQGGKRKRRSRKAGKKTRSRK